MFGVKSGRIFFFQISTSLSLAPATQLSPPLRNVGLSVPGLPPPNPNTRGCPQAPTPILPVPRAQRYSGTLSFVYNLICSDNCLDFTPRLARVDPA